MYVQSIGIGVRELGELSNCYHKDNDDDSKGDQGTKPCTHIHAVFEGEIVGWHLEDISEICETLLSPRSTAPLFNLGFL